MLNPLHLVLVTVGRMVIDPENAAAVGHRGGPPMHHPASPPERTSLTGIQDSTTEMTVTARVRRIPCHSLVLVRCLDEEPMGRGVESGSEAGG